ncbi:hypothetical protein SAMN05878482_1011231 [Peribacillus simplex]|uniref:Uncharacterized protein n=1 Tax=Peribacillus simplex TaxID=1478 RepID=A0A9X8R5B9_9BACI|nr:hypothetical protein SAMN05878482_1011231 [Peribacillus simplex]
MFTSENYRGQGILTVLLSKLVDVANRYLKKRAL